MSESHVITNSDCIKVLKNFLQDENFSFKSFEFKPISKNVEGFLGEHYYLLIKYEQNGQEHIANLFIKTKSTKNQIQIELANSLNVYKREIFFYDYLLTEFKKYGLNVSFASESYYHIKDTTIVMENLIQKGFSLIEKPENLSLDHIKVVLKALALYHAAGFAYERIKSRELDKNFKLGVEFEEYMKEIIYVQWIDPNAYFMNFWKGSKNTFSTIISLLPSEIFDNKHFQQLLDNFEIGKIFVEETNISKTCGHGDLWYNNMMFKYDSTGKPVDCKLVDFQNNRYFYPSFDVVLFIYCNTDTTFRKKHLTEMYRYYYDLLGNALKNYGFLVEEIHPWNDFLKSINLVLADAFSQIVKAKLINSLSKEQKTNFVAKGEDSYKEFLFDNSKIMSDAFKTNEKSRKIIIEIMREFYDILQEKSKIKI